MSFTKRSYNFIAVSLSIASSLFALHWILSQSERSLITGTTLAGIVYFLFMLSVKSKNFDEHISLEPLYIIMIVNCLMMIPYLIKMVGIYNMNDFQIFSFIVVILSLLLTNLLLYSEDIKNTNLKIILLSMFLATVIESSSIQVNNMSVLIIDEVTTIILGKNDAKELLNQNLFEINTKYGLVKVEQEVYNKLNVGDDVTLSIVKGKLGFKFKEIKNRGD